MIKNGKPVFARCRGGFKRFKHWDKLAVEVAFGSLLRMFEGRMFAIELNKQASPDGCDRDVFFFFFLRGAGQIVMVLPVLFEGFFFFVFIFLVRFFSF